MTYKNVTMDHLFLNLGKVYHELPTVLKMRKINPAIVNNDASIETMMDISQQWVRQFVQWCGNILFKHIKHAIQSERLTDIQGAIIISEVFKILQHANSQMCAPIVFV